MINPFPEQRLSSGDLLKRTGNIIQHYILKNDFDKFLMQKELDRRIFYFTYLSHNQNTTEQNLTCKD